MRRLGACGLALVLALGWGAACARSADDDADDEDAKPQPRPFVRLSPVFARMVQVDPTSSSSKKPPPKPAKEGKSGKSKNADSTKSAKDESPAAAARAREEAALIRRLEVCDKLMEVAIRTNDQELIHRVEELDVRARSIYARHTGALAGKGGGFESDEKSLDRHLGLTSSAKNPGGLGVASSAATGTREGQASAREENP
jgi:hypothetical protein